MKFKKQISFLTVLLMLCLSVFPFGGVTKVRAAADVQITYSPALGGSLEGTAGEISLTFSQPLEWYGPITNGRIQIFEDTDEDGVGDVIVQGNGPGGVMHDGAVILSEDGHKAVFQINDKLEVDKYYVIIMTSQLKVKGTGTEITEANILADIGNGTTRTGWNFNTVTPLEMKSLSPADGASLGGTTGEISISFNKAVTVTTNPGPGFQIALFEDTDGDGIGNGSGVVGGSAFLSNVLSVSSTDPTKVILSINQIIQKNKAYVVTLIPYPNFCRISSSAIPTQVYPGLGSHTAQTGWRFNTYEVQAVEISGDSSIVEGNPLNLTAVMKDINGSTLTEEEVTWSSGNTQVATVDTAGTVTALEPGMAVITATSKTNPTAKAELEITVSSAPWRILNDEIGELPDASEITLANEAAVTDLLARYNQLSQTDQAKVTNYQKLSDAKAMIDKIYADQSAAEAVVAKINALPVSVTLEDKTKVEEARSAYTALTPDQQALVTNLNVLENAETRISQLEASKAQAQVVIELIDGLGSITLEKAPEVSATRTAYTNLSEEARSFVTNLSVLAEAESKIAALTADKEAADAVITKIDNLPAAPVLGDAPAIEAARAAYTALTLDQQALVTNLSKLVTAETVINKLKDDKAAADAVVAKINALPATITLGDAGKISDARNAYINLTEDQKALVENLQTLVAAEETYSKLLADKTEADRVTGLISALPDNITLSDATKVAAAARAYDELTPDQKNLVENSGKLAAAVLRIAELEAQKATVDKAIKDITESQGDIVSIKIDNLPELSTEIIEAIKDSNKEVTFIKEDNGKTIYSWTLDGSKINDAGRGFSLNIDFTTSAASAIDKLVGNSDSIYIHFSHHGSLPAEALIKIYVGDKYDDGTKLNLYYYNETNGKAEEISKGLEVKEGYVSFAISHCSDYFLTQADLEKSSQQLVTQDEGKAGKKSVSTRDGAPIDFLSASLLISLAGIIILNKKRVYK